MAGVVGIDPSTRTGMVRLLGDSEETKIIEFAGETGQQRLSFIQKSVNSVLETWAPDLIVIEGYGYANKWSLVILVEIGTLIRQVIHHSGVPWYEVPPSVLKKLTTGNGRAKKEDMAVAVKQLWQFENTSNDVVDAYALAQIGRKIAEAGLTPKLKGIKHGH